MKHLLLFLLFNSTLFSAELSESKQKVLAIAAQNQVELRLDQSYADNDNPKQKVDLYLPGKRNSSKPLPVVAFIHGGGWVNGDRLGYAAAAIQPRRAPPADR